MPSSSASPLTGSGVTTHSIVVRPQRVEMQPPQYAFTTTLATATTACIDNSNVTSCFPSPAATTLPLHGHSTLKRSNSDPSIYISVDCDEDSASSSSASACAAPLSGLDWLRTMIALHGTSFAFYSQFMLVSCYYLVEYLTVLGILDRPQGYISGVPLVVLLLTVLNTLAFRAMHRLQLLTILVEFVCALGLIVYEDLAPHDLDDRHRTELYDIHTHACAINFVLLVLYAAVWTSGHRKWTDEERSATDKLLGGKELPNGDLEEMV